MGFKPLVSIIMPIYGVEKYIEESVKSVISQNYDNIELILVDDGTPDKSIEIAERVLQEAGFQYLLIRQENQGQGEARNVGIRKASGEWILFLDSDDMLLPETVSELVACIDNPDIDLVFSNYRVIYTAADAFDNTSSDYHCDEMTAGDLQKRFLLRESVVLVVGTLFSKQLIHNEHLAFESIPWSEDQHFVWKYLSFIQKAVYVDKAYYQYLQRPGSTMTASGIDKMIQSYPAICELPKYYENNKLVSEFLVPRWVMGTLNAAARITDFENWRLLFVKLDGSRHMKSLVRFPQEKVRLIALLFCISKRLYYGMMRKRQ